ncbi:unnamed protein product [Brassica oleracea var. botrytis]
MRNHFPLQICEAKYSLANLRRNFFSRKFAMILRAFFICDERFTTEYVSSQ